MSEQHQRRRGAVEAVREQPTSLPPRAYTDPEVFCAERQLVLGREWVPVAREEDLASPGDFLTCQIATDPVVVVRDETGQLRAFANVCRHRNTVMVEGAGSARSLRCPHHLWSYDLRGALVGVPGRASTPHFERSRYCLPQLAVEVWLGWVFVNLDGSAAPLRPRLTHLEQRCAPYSLADMRRAGMFSAECPWNWKVTIENFAESYHHAGTHPRTLQPWFPGQRSQVASHGDEPWIWLDHESTKDGVEPFAAAVVFPCLLFSIIRPDAMAWFRLDARSAHRSQLEVHLFTHPDGAVTAEGAKTLLRQLEAVNNEDAHINARTQAGLQSRFAQPGPLMSLEEGIRRFQRWLLDHLDPPNGG